MDSYLGNEVNQGDHSDEDSLQPAFVLEENVDGIEDDDQRAAQSFLLNGDSSPTSLMIDFISQETGEDIEEYS